MHTPQHNSNYSTSAVADMQALSSCSRFLLLHGASDDNVHFQNSLTLLDKLDIAGVENYDVHVFPDSDHGIYFHGANRMVWDKLRQVFLFDDLRNRVLIRFSWWLTNAFNGVWEAIEKPVPLKEGVALVGNAHAPAPKS